MEKILKKLAWFIIAAPSIYLVIIWKNIPDTVPMHVNLKGDIDRYGSKNELILFTAILTVINVLIYVLLPRVYKIDRKKHASENKDKLYRIAFAICVFISAAVCFMIYSSMHSNLKWTARLIIVGKGLLFAVVGNYLYTIKPNYFAGIRLPWTLNNDENWKKTHLLAGKLFFGSGLIIAMIGLFTPFITSLILVLAILVIIMTIICAYSYRLHKRMQVSS